MGKIVGQAKISVSATLELTEEELGALEALAGYGDEAFIEVFYKHLGESYLKPKEAGLRSLFAAVRAHVPAILARGKEARAALVPK